MQKGIIHTDLAPHPLANYSQAWAVSESKLIFTSGQTPVDMNGNSIGVGDIVLQTRTVFQNIEGVLNGAGVKLKDVIKITIYVTNMADYIEKAGKIRGEYFPKDFPSSTLVEVKSLARPEFMVEIEAIAATDY